MLTACRGYAFSSACVLPSTVIRYFCDGFLEITKKIVTEIPAFGDNT
jgi:hypothetical protein